MAHARGALVYADIIQAVGVVPIDLPAMGVDFAPANGYKWLYGVHGADFLYVRADLQGTALPDGHVRFNVPPWVGAPDPELDDLMFVPRSDARRYEPGHVSYLSYCGVYEGLRFLHRIGIDAASAHSVRLNKRLLHQIDFERYRRLTPDIDRSPILSLALPDRKRLESRLRAMDIVVTLGPNYIRISPAVYNNDEDVDRLGEALNATA